MDEQKAHLQGLWRKAAKMDRALEIPCGTAANAKSLRMALYNAVREARAGQGPGELVAAVKNCSISFSEGDKAKLLIQRKILSSVMQTVMGLLADSPELVREDGAEDLEESQRRLLEKLGGELDGEGAIGPRSTPYYTRER